jgi:Secretion system C-terminal sorting domain
MKKTKSPDWRPQLETYLKNAKGVLPGRQFNAAARPLDSAMLKALPCVLLSGVGASETLAQCQPAKPPFEIPQNGSVGFDVDGTGGNDFVIKHVWASIPNYNSTQYRLFIVPQAGFYAQTQGIPNQLDAVKANIGVLVKRNDANLIPMTSLGSGPLLRQKPFGASTSGPFATPGYLPIRKGNATTGQPGWIYLDVTLTANGATVNIGLHGVESLTNTPLNSAVTGDCSTIDASLPVELIAFKAKAEGFDVKLDWATASEHNNAGFQIERSENGADFRAIGWVEGRGTTTEKQTYVFEDPRLQSGRKYYYRLKQMDTDGSFKYSKIVNVRVGGRVAAAGDFAPNPAADGQVKLDFTAQAAADWNVAVFDAAGRELYRETRAVNKGNQRLNFDFSNLSKGLFFVKMSSGQEQLYRKLVID